MRAFNLIALMAAIAKAKLIGVSLYESQDFFSSGVGWHLNFGAGEHSGDFPDDVATSFIVDEGCCAEFFEYVNYEGKKFSKCGMVRDIIPDDWPGVIGSLKIECTSEVGDNKDLQIDIGEGDMQLDDDTLRELAAL